MKCSDQHYSFLQAYFLQKPLKKLKVMITPFVHGIIDYLYGISLTATPWVLGFDKTGAETFLSYIAAGVVFLYSLLTKYQLSIAKILSMKTHLLIDVMVSGFLIVSPWLFGFANKVYLPHVLFGIAGFAVILLSSGREPASVRMKSMEDRFEYVL